MIRQLGGKLLGCYQCPCVSAGEGRFFHGGKAMRLPRRVESAPSGWLDYLFPGPCEYLSGPCDTCYGKSLLRDRVTHAKVHDNNEE